MSAPTVLRDVITFYSYKGGTGRSMALANVACLLGRAYADNKKVLVIDWDLEAPGLHYYLVLPERPEFKTGHPGVVELFAHLQEKLKSEPDPTSKRC